MRRAQKEWKKQTATIKGEGKPLDSEEKPTVHCGRKKEEGKEENE